MKGDPEYLVLQDALRVVQVPCHDDTRFILDPSEYSSQELDYLSVTYCRRCPVRDLCRAYGEAARPPAGVWAGRTYPPRERGRRAT